MNFVSRRLWLFLCQEEKSQEKWMKLFLFLQYFQSITLNNLCRSNKYEYIFINMKSRECFQWIDACSQCRRFLYGHLMSLYHCGGLLVEEPNSSFTVSTRDFIISEALRILDNVLYQNVINKNLFSIIYMLQIYFDINWAGLITQSGNIFADINILSVLYIMWNNIWQIPFLFFSYFYKNIILLNFSCKISQLLSNTCRKFVLWIVLFIEFNNCSI